MAHTITDLLAKLRESYEVETDLVTHYLEAARARAAFHIEAKFQHKVSADEAVREGLLKALGYIRNKKGNVHMDRTQFKALLFAIVEKQVTDQLDREKAKMRDVRREVSIDAVNLSRMLLMPRR